MTHMLSRMRQVICYRACAARASDCAVSAAVWLDRALESGGTKRDKV